MTSLNNNLCQVNKNKWTSKNEQILAKLFRLESNLIYLHAELQIFWCLMEWSCSGFQTMYIGNPLIQYGLYSGSSFVSHLCGTQNAFSHSSDIIMVIRSSGQPPSFPERTMLLKHHFTFSEKIYKNDGCFHTSNQTTQENNKIEKDYFGNAGA